ncbi:MAG: rubrerythrin [Candidatus Kerfeldbacteria bacterium RIFOXYA2_FULL_38_24]|uniref:Rubrerythrin n=1 Tax=Candidatus Kerfeldbacteria bacterium RIFOXYB2_FULL_38_14 TaxID=1798547 RepID=A0A1G2BG63_9BACT|nr:MAG: rubrerythrin [Candidatus Kerfeldbacteria bacterium RIFOXYA2_FULL_38_24]OGY88213.1 MAG: rubrerythrin [Candidatus Kerfeldbacteria bacterium RIFOXYB2_FULL_38_14]
MPQIKGTQTEKNLLKAFAGESQARMRYDYFSRQAQKEGLEQISGIFAETALNEKEHAKKFFKFLEGGNTEIIATYPAGKIGNTLENLQAAAAGEHEEWTLLYQEFAKVAQEEGFTEVSVAFKMIAAVEKAHEERYQKLYQNLEQGKVFVRENKLIWKCRNCGYLHEGASAPQNCPACLHPQSFFEIKADNY